MSDGERVRQEAGLFFDGEYERCGTFGCILENKHAGLHVFAMAHGARSRRRGEAMGEHHPWHHREYVKRGEAERGEVERGEGGGGAAAAKRAKVQSDAES